MSIGGSTESNVRSFETFVTIYLSIITRNTGCHKIGVQTAYYLIEDA
jgi:hypothetical protein